MLRTNLAKRTLVATLALCSIPLVSFAGVETLGPYLSTTYTGTGSPNFSFTNIQSFDTSLGQLSGVEFILTLDEKADLTVTNKSKSATLKFSDATADFNGPKIKGVQEGAKVTLDIPTTGGPETLVTYGPAIDIGPESGSLNPGQKKTYKESGDGSDSLAIGDPTSMYTSGTYSLDGVFKGLLGDINGKSKSGDVEFAGGEDLVACLEVEYFYTDCCCVPEPSTWALMGLSLVGLCFLRRKRVKVS